MSKFVKVQTQLRDLAVLKQALRDLKLDYAEDQRFTHLWSGFSGTVPVVVRTQGATFGLRLSEDGHYEAVGDDMQMATIRRTLGRIQQRYAYHAVLAATKEAGFDLVEENVGSDQVIRLTVRRWS
jgi:hypothetical protein